jgi:predicted small lipoprotein YifL
MVAPVRIRDSTRAMTLRRCISLLALSSLAACSQKAPVPQDSGTPLNAVRVPLPESQPLPAAPAGNEKPIWAGAPGGDSVRYGAPGLAPISRWPAARGCWW